jgi:hypothetical protein
MAPHDNPKNIFFTPSLDHLLSNENRLMGIVIKQNACHTGSIPTMVIVLPTEKG